MAPAGLPPTIENPNSLPVSADIRQVLLRMFRGYRRVILRRQLIGGRNGSFVFEVHPIRSNGIPELPAVIKCAPISLIQREWRAYRKHIRNRLPYIAAISQSPVSVPELDWGALRYPLARSGAEVLNLAEYCTQLDVDLTRLQHITRQLIRVMHHLWGYHHTISNFRIDASYDAVLPVNLLLQPDGTPPKAEDRVRVITTRTMNEASVGERIALSHVRVQRSDPIHRTVTAELLPESTVATSKRIRLQYDQEMLLPAFQTQQRLPPFTATVLGTRAAIFHRSVAALVGSRYAEDQFIPLSDLLVPNPVHALPEILAQRRGAQIGSIHGDLNLENILIDPEQDIITLIDFSEAREDHVLHDLMHLESEIFVHLLSRVLPTEHDQLILGIARILWDLHCQLLGKDVRLLTPTHDHVLNAIWVLLSHIRRTVRHYLFDVRDPREYYTGLVLYYLGILRHRSNASTSATTAPHIAFHTATLLNLWRTHTDLQTPPAALVTLLQATDTAALHLRSSQPHDLTADSLTDAKRLILPTDTIPPRGHLPAGSRMGLAQNLRFVGRSAELQQLAARFSAGKSESVVVAITGLGGVGKTQLACEFAYRFGRFFTGGIFWLSCAYPDSFASEIAACGEQSALDLQVELSDLSLEERVQIVLHAWAQRPPKLFILDSCEDSRLLDEWRDRLGGGILITSRRSDWNSQTGEIRQLMLDKLKRTESIALLREHQPDANDSSLEEIADILGDLPLALHMAGSYLMRNRLLVNAVEYLTTLRTTSVTRHLSLQVSEILPTEHDSNVVRTFALSYDQLDRLEPIAELALVVLRWIACVAPDEPVPEALIRLAYTGAAGYRSTNDSPDVLLPGAISHLISLGLLRPEPQGAVRLHRLLGAYVLERMGPDVTDAIILVEQIVNTTVAGFNRSQTPAELRNWHTHLRFIADRALARDDAAAAEYFQTLGEHLFLIGDYAGARRYISETLRIYTRVYGVNHTATARAQSELGRALFSLGDMAQSEQELRRALEQQERLLGEHLETAMTLNLLGFLLQQQQELAEPFTYHQRALAIRRSQHGDDHLEVVESLCNIAFIEFRNGQLQNALSSLLDALAIQRRISGSSHPNTARVLTNLSELYVALQQVDTAQSVAREALAIAEATLGAHHPETARTLRGLGEILILTQAHEEARSLLERAYTIFVRSHGEHHYRTQRVAQKLHELSLNAVGSVPPTDERYANR